MEKVSIVGLDIAKNSFHAHGAAADGSKVFSKALPRGRVLEILGQIEPCTIALEACAGAHHWSRELSRLGHEVRLIAPQYVKPYVKRHLLTGQRTQTINALRGHLAEHGIVAPKGPQHLPRLERAVVEKGERLPADVTNLCQMFFDLIDGLSKAPRQHSTGGKTRLGKISKMGQRDLRRLLIIGAMSAIQAAQKRGGAPDGSWLARMLARKPKMLVAVALANKMARMAWAIMAHGGVYETPANA